LHYYVTVLSQFAKIGMNGRWIGMNGVLLSEDEVREKLLRQLNPGLGRADYLELIENYPTKVLGSN